MRKFKSKKGFTLAEVLLVVGILAILATVVILSVVDYLRSTTKLEYDGYAKSIFVAAQNHLTMAEHEGFLGRTNFGDEEGAGTGVYRLVVENGVCQNGDDSVWDLILPPGSVDETVRSGSYVIRYQKSPAQILDVFYWSDNGRYAYSYTNGDYYTLLDIAGQEDKREQLRDFEGSVIGYYGGTEAGDARGAKLNAPQIQLVNAEKLYVLVNNPNPDEDYAKLKLVIHGETSNKSKEIDLVKTDSTYWDTGSNQFRIVLDDITENEKHFAQQFSDAGLIAGEDIKVYAVAYNDQVYTNVAFSSEQVTNSLFGECEIDADNTLETLGVANIRHLENLDIQISEFDTERLRLGTGFTAAQTSDLSWKNFVNAIDPEDPENVVVYDKIGEHKSAEPGCYEPINPNYNLHYDGQNHTIADLKINARGYAGLFGRPTGQINVMNLKLQDFNVTGTNGAGTLAGYMKDSQVRNVLVCQSSDLAANVGVTATSGWAGGLIGESIGTRVNASAAAVYVTSEADGAGGLIGKVEGGKLSGCYSAGFTVGAAYETEEDSYNVTAPTGMVGGLVAKVDGADISYSYSTCSVSGVTAGGLVGTTNEDISYSYCTGLVNGSGMQGAFAATLSTNEVTVYEGNYYFSIVNGGIPAVSDGPTGASAFDTSTASYRAFVSTGSETNPRSNASPYDDTLVAYYQGKYNLRTVNQLGDGADNKYPTDENDFVNTHYGDWPAPEILVVNTPEGT